MTYREAKELLESIGLPVCYYSWPVGGAPSLPYIVYYYPSSDDLFADNQNYGRIENVNIELYTENKDFTTEARVEEALNASHIPFSRTESYLSDENMYEVLYQCQFVINK